MKKLKFRWFITLFFLATFTTVMLGMAPSFSQVKSSESVGFFCQNTFDKASQQQLPTTVAWIPEKQGHIRIITWKSEAIAGWTPRERCEVVSSKFHKFYEAGKLNYLTNGKVRGYPVVCAVAK
ncbi:hypothetical protein NIES2111_20100 [Nostoc sp. NIES-2111]|nr:hypothetical protein NIES2111_20100 [Nostoc sp. NIES-2111]